MARAPQGTRATSLGGLVDLLVVTLLVATAAIGFATSFTEPVYVRAVVGGTLLGLAIAWCGARLRWSVLAVAAATLAGYLLAGGALALADTTLGGVVPTLETVRALALGAVHAWKDLLTVAPPLDTFPALLLVPFLATYVVSVLAGSLALRARHPAWALLPSGVLLVGVIALGTQATVLPLVQGVVFAVVALAWVAWRRAEARSAALRGTRTDPGPRPESARLRNRRLRNAAALLGGVAVVAALVAPTLAPATYRHVLRDVVEPPLDLRQYPSPLVGFRKYVKDLEKETLFTVTGLPDGARLRLATMDAYTGTVIDVAGGDTAVTAGSGSFGRVGREIAAPEGVALDGDAVEVTVTVEGYRGAWLPGIGYAGSIRFAGEDASELQRSLYYNAETGSALTTAILDAGDAYTMTAVVPDEPSADEIAGLSLAPVQLPEPQKVPQSVGSSAETFAAGATEPWDQLNKLREALATGGIFSDGLEGEPPSRAGHGADRIETLLADLDMVGDDEQFAVAMALMARQLGIPARVVMGFYPAQDAATTAAGGVAITGTDAHAWVEVPFQDGSGIRWVSLDPTPDEDQQPQEQDPRANSKPEPQVLQEPPPPEEPAEPPLQAIPEAAENDDAEQEGLPWGRYLGTAAAVGIPLLVLLSPFALIVLAKSRRRRQRLASAQTVERVSGGWREVVDTAVDLGTPVLASATRRETARDLEERYPGTGPLAVAAVADAAVFGPGEPTDADVAAFWAEVDTLVSGLTGSVGRWRRLRARFSLRSFRLGRDRTRPPRGGRR